MANFDTLFTIFYFFFLIFSPEQHLDFPGLLLLQPIQHSLQEQHPALIVLSMKKKSEEMRTEYDFSKAERGKFYRPLDKGYTVHVTKKDGTVVVNHYTLAEGTVLLAPDVLEYFPDSEAVNEALRLLIKLMDKVPARKYKTHRSVARQIAERK